MIVAIITAHGEVTGLARALASLRAQTSPPGRVVVLPAGPADGAADVARRAGAEVLDPAGQVRGRAGALNRALDALGLAGEDHVLVLDAGTRLAPGFVARALEELRDPRIGAVGAVSRGEDPKGWAQRMQQLEWTRCAGEVHRGGRTGVLSGTASLIRWRALQDVQWIFGRCYDEGSATEDARLALDLRSAGWWLSSPPECRSTTEPAPTARRLFRQRRRRYLGALQDVTAYGFTGLSASCRRRRLVRGLPALLLALHLSLTAAALLFGWFGIGLPWLGVGAVLAAERVATVWDAGPRARLAAAAVLPELGYALLLLAALVAALHQHLADRAGARQHVPAGTAGTRG